MENVCKMADGRKKAPAILNSIGDVVIGDVPEMMLTGSVEKFVAFDAGLETVRTFDDVHTVLLRNDHIPSSTCRIHSRQSTHRVNIGE